MKGNSVRDPIAGRSAYQKPGLANAPLYQIRRRFRPTPMHEYFDPARVRSMGHVAEVYLYVGIPCMEPGQRWQEAMLREHLRRTYDKRAADIGCRPYQAFIRRGELVEQRAASLKINFAVGRERQSLGSAVEKVAAKGLLEGGNELRHRRYADV